MRRDNFKALTIFLFLKIGHLTFSLAALFHVLICISLSEFLSGFSWYKTLRTFSCIIKTAHLYHRKCQQHFRTSFGDDFSLMGGILRRLLVSFATKYHGKFYFPIELCCILCQDFKVKSLSLKREGSGKAGSGSGSRSPSSGFLPTRRGSLFGSTGKFIIHHSFTHSLTLSYSDFYTIFGHLVSQA